MLKKDKMVTDNNSHIITLFTKVKTISQQIENSDIVRRVYLGISRHIQGHSAISSHVQAYWGKLILKIASVIILMT